MNSMPRSLSMTVKDLMVPGAYLMLNAQYIDSINETELTTPSVSRERSSTAIKKLSALNAVVPEWRTVGCACTLLKS